MAKSTKIISFHSPISQTGQTSVANLVGLALANQGKYVAILELSKYTGMSVFLNKSLGNLKSDLKTCLIEPNKVKNNLVESKHNNKLFFLCQSTKSTASDLMSYNAANIDEIVSQLYGAFDYVFIDLPSEINDVAVVRVLSNQFTHKIDHHVIVITENILALKKLNDYDNVISKSVTNKSEREKTTLVVNKSRGRYSPLFGPYLSELPYTEIVNLVNVLNVDEFPYLCNEGNILNLGKTKESKEFLGSIDMIAKIIDKEITGVGVYKNSKASKTQRKYNKASKLNKSTEDKKGLFGFGKKDKSKREKPPKKEKKPKMTRGKKNKQLNQDIQSQDTNYQQTMDMQPQVNPYQQPNQNPYQTNPYQTNGTQDMNLGSNIPRDLE